MKRVLGLIGSPRKMGNCELMVKEIVARLPEPAELRLVRLPEKEIRPCKACYRCLTGECPLKDDWAGVMDAILSADAVIAAAPAYIHGTHSSIQRFLDRGLQIWRHADALSGKPAAAVATAGVADGEGFALLGVENLVRAMGMTLKGRELVLAALPGEALLSDRGRESAARVAAALFAPGAWHADGPSCPECGGTFFEFRAADRVYCVLCGAGGTVASGAEGVRLTTRPPLHSWRGVSAMKAHGDWLVAMREKYLRERERLKEVARVHAGGDFI